MNVPVALAGTGDRSLVGRRGFSQSRREKAIGADTVIDWRKHCDLLPQFIEFIKELAKRPGVIALTIR
ncbi:hypothetical protein [Lysobacter enzymogenes]|uniref:hypothetical protein n=1 Tax=Lysobacter enzymogenes TaxID=69 RepID=UPI001A95800B|nr:hypothetical protein [Lysobacter enzymogenes]QQP97701.1 hypothetical protein JHW38_06720 [Lysobacter enzymogenes]